MQPTVSQTPASFLPVPGVDPGGGAPAASVPASSEGMLEESAVNAFGALRDRVLSRPLSYVAAAFSLGFALARLLR